MQDQPDQQLRTSIHALLCGDLPADQADKVLCRIAREDRARELLRESIELRDRSRAAFGYDRAGEAAGESLARLTASSMRSRRAARLLRVLGAAAAAIVIVASVLIAAVLHDSNRRLRDELAGARASLKLPRLTDAELGKFRQIWTTVSEDTNRTMPWVLLSDDCGEFGYLPGSSAPRRGGSLILVRFLLAAPDGRQAAAVNLLIPARRNLRLSVPAAARLAGLPVSCDIVTDGHWAAVGLSVGRPDAGDVGVRGRVSIGTDWLEIGEFRLDGRRMRVAVQARPLDRPLG